MIRYRLRPFFEITILAVVAILSYAARTGKHEDPNKITRVIYQFDDANMDSKENRSYLITAQPKRVVLEVKSWQKRLDKKKYKFTLAQFDSLVNKHFEIFEIDKSKLSRYQACPGCNSHKLYFYKGDVQFQEFAWADGEGNFKIMSMVEDLRDLVPDLKLLTTLPKEEKNN
ncbi:MAG: hypothetical protein M3Q97_01910 [Bacteroidota bacterium]|nr:hypothetical protein [Bacteroidota bacterium]